MQLPHFKKKPVIHPTAFIEKSSQIIGDVEIGENSSVWFNAVIRGDVHFIKIGNRTNIQDGSILHVTRDIFPLTLEDDITVGHGVILHGCIIRSRCLIGMGALILDGAEIGNECIIAAGTVIKEGHKIPPRSLVAGIPGKIKRAITEKDINHINRSSINYTEYKKAYEEQLL